MSFGAKFSSKARQDWPDISGVLGGKRGMASNVGVCFGTLKGHILARQYVI